MYGGRVVTLIVALLWGAATRVTSDSRWCRSTAGLRSRSPWPTSTTTASSTSYRPRVGTRRRWTKRPIRTIPVTSGYVDSFSDLPLDVDGDGFTDVIQIGYFARRIVWMKNPGASGGAWTENLIDAIGPTEFAFLVDLDNDGKADDLLPQFTGAAGAPLTWYELQDGKWVKHIVSTQSYGHGIGAGDVNGDKRNDILTPQGWLEAPADPRAAGNWTFHATDWQQRPIPAPPRPRRRPSPRRRRGSSAGRGAPPGLPPPATTARLLPHLPHAARSGDSCMCSTSTATGATTC